MFFFKRLSHENVKNHALLHDSMTLDLQELSTMKNMCAYNLNSMIKEMILARTCKKYLPRTC